MNDVLLEIFMRWQTLIGPLNVRCQHLLASLSISSVAYNECLVPHEHGSGVKQVDAVTMREAGNATHYADSFSVHGVAMCAVYSLGPLLGGRTPTVSNGINLAGLSLLDIFKVNKKSFKVTCVTIVFRD